MFNTYLATWTPGPIEFIAILLYSLIIYGVPIALIVLVVRYIMRSKKERLKLQMDISKIADELEQIRKKIEPNEQNDSPSESG